MTFELATAPDTSYNGWTNYETWNVALWINNDEGLYRNAVRYVQQCERLDETVDYTQLAEVIAMLYGPTTGDGVSWTDISQLDTTELDQMLTELLD